MIGSYNRYLPTTALFPRILRQISSLYHVLPSPSPIPAVSTCSLLHLHNRTVVGSHRRTGFSTGCDYSLSQCSPSHPCSSMTMVFFYNSRSCKKTGRHSHSVWYRPRFLPISFRDQRFHPVPQQSTCRGFASYGGVVSGGTMAVRRYNGWDVDVWCPNLSPYIPMKEPIANTSHRPQRERRFIFPFPVLHYLELQAIIDRSEIATVQVLCCQWHSLPSHTFFLGSNRENLLLHLRRKIFLHIHVIDLRISDGDCREREGQLGL